MVSSAQLSWTDREPTVSSFLADAVEGLSSTPKRLAAKYFYDARGSELFEKITQLPEYYLTRTEIEILGKNASAIIEACGGEFALIEFGSGSSTKVRILLDAMERKSCYIPVDISPELLRLASEELTRIYPDLTVAAVCADYTRPFEIPACVSSKRKVIFFPGSTIGNFEPAEAHSFIEKVAHDLAPGDSMIIGFDLKKDEDTLNAAYNDEEGVTAAFNMNLLVRMNRELDADFDLSRFEHVAFYNVDAGRIEMHLRSLTGQQVTIGVQPFSFQEGELLHTENSYKYSVRDVERIIEGTGFIAAEQWTDDRNLFSVQRLVMR